MRNIIIVVAILWATHGHSQDSTNFFSKANLFLSVNVSEGKVDYQKIHKDQKQLNSLVQLIEDFSVAGLSSDKKKAFYINAYNLLVIKQVINFYPLESPKKIPSFFSSQNFVVAKQVVSLNELEKAILFAQYKDARLHFVLVCAAVGCPRIEPFAYTPENIDNQLNTQAINALNNSNFIKVNHHERTVQISKIFSWYEADFANQNENTLDYINRFRAEKIPLDYKVSYYNYDWALNELRSKNNNTKSEQKSNLQTFTPSALFQIGQFEVNVFNSIYSQNATRDSEGEKIKSGITENYFTSMIQFTTGISKKAKYNVGVDFFVSKARVDNGNESALKVFSSDEDAVFNKTLLSYIAPRIKFSPFSTIPRFSVQSSLWIPTSDALEKDGFVAHNRYTWFTQLFFDKSFGEYFQLFLEADFLYRIKSEELQNQNFFRTPLSAFISYFPNPESTLFLFTQYSPRFENVVIDEEKRLGLTQWFTQVGIGAKYQLTDEIGVEVSYSDFVASRQDGAGYNLNFGLRYIHR